MRVRVAMYVGFGSPSHAQIPNLGASGAIAAVLGAYFVLYPNSRIRTLLGWFPINIPAWFFLGGWFLYQFFESNYALFHPSNTGDSDVAFFAHVAGFIFSALVTSITPSTRRLTPHTLH